MPDPKDAEPLDSEEKEGVFEEILRRGVVAPDEASDGDIVPIAPRAQRRSLPVKEGEVLRDRYLIERFLAKGGAGLVVRAHDQKVDRHVAIKLLLPHVAEDAIVRARFELEARIAQKIKTEHVPEVLDVGELPDGTKYIVMEYLHGEDLTRLLYRRGRLRVREAVDLVLQACEAIAAAHGAGIVHRDIKPSNLFLTKRNDGSVCVKVIDFGLAKSHLLDGSRDPNEPSLTHSKVIGTPRHMAPEQILSSREADARADIWALGILLYELLTGQPPFDAPAIHAIFAAILHQAPPPLRERAPSVPEGLQAIIERCLEKEPDKRYQSVADLAVALAKFGSDESGGAVDRAVSLAPPPVARDPKAKRAAGPAGGTNVATIAEAKATKSADRKGGADPKDSGASPKAAAAAGPPIATASGRWPVLIMFGAVLLIAGAVALLFAKGGISPTTPQPVIGAPCRNDRMCGDLSCMEGVCSKACENQAACPPPSRCMSDGLCSVPLRVGLIYVGVPEDEGWTRTHDRGRKDAQSKLPWLETDFVIDAHRPEVAERAIDELVSRGFQIIVANSFSLREPVAKKAKQHPSVKFLVYSYPPSPEVGAFGAKLEQAWYLAGYAAAQKSRSKRLGFVGSLVTPEVVRYINAFTRGAQRTDPSIKVEVRWLGFWFDTDKPDASGRHKEHVLAQELLATGCDVIAHNADNGRVVEAVEAAGKGALSIGNNDPDACEKGPTTCMGSVAWNWGPLYTTIFRDIHRGAWTPATRYSETIRANPEQSVVNFVASSKVLGSALALDTATVLAELTNDASGKRVFEGPFCWAGQPDACLAKGESPSEEELRTLCRHVAGVVQKADPKDPKSPDLPALPPPECMKQQ